MRRAAHRERPAYGGNERSPRALVDSGHVRSVRASVPAGSSGTRRRARRDLPECSLGRRGRRAAATPLAPRLGTRGRSESLNRAFSGGCEYPVEEPPPRRALEERERREARTGVSRLARVGPPTASDAADESGAGRIRPAASPSVRPPGLGAGNRPWRPQIAPLGDAPNTAPERAISVAEPEKNRRYARPRPAESSRAVPRKSRARTRNDRKRREPTGTKNRRSHRKCARRRRSASRENSLRRTGRLATAPRPPGLRECRLTRRGSRASYRLRGRLGRVGDRHSKGPAPDEDRPARSEFRPPREPGSRNRCRRCPEDRRGRFRRDSVGSPLPGGRRPGPVRPRCRSSRIARCRNRRAGG